MRPGQIADQLQATLGVFGMAPLVNSGDPVSITVRGVTATGVVLSTEATPVVRLDGTGQEIEVEWQYINVPAKVDIPDPSI